MRNCILFLSEVYQKANTHTQTSTYTLTLDPATLAENIPAETKGKGKERTHVQKAL